MSQFGFLVLLSFALGAALTGCGGGGSGGDASTPTADTVNVAVAWRNVLAANQTWTTSGKGSDNRDYVLTLHSVPGAAAAYPRTGQSGATSVHRTTIRVNGIDVSSSSTNFIDASGQLFGIRNDDGTCESFNLPPTALPGAAAVGNSGALATSTEYPSCVAGASQASSSNVYTWSVQSDAGVAFLCVELRSSDTAGAVKGTEQNCFEAAPDGTLGARARFTVNVPGVLQIVAKTY